MSSTDQLVMGNVNIRVLIESDTAFNQFPIRVRNLLTPKPKRTRPDERRPLRRKMLVLALASGPST